MKMIPSRQLAARPGQVWDSLREEGAVVITKDGSPRSIMVPTSDATLLEDIQDLVFARSRRAVRALREEAERQGTAGLSMNEIDREIAAARRDRSVAG